MTSVRVNGCAIYIRIRAHVCVPVCCECSWSADSCGYVADALLSAIATQETARWYLLNMRLYGKVDAYRHGPSP